MRLCSLHVLLDPEVSDGSRDDPQGDRDDGKDIKGFPLSTPRGTDIVKVQHCLCIVPVDLPTELLRGLVYDQRSLQAEEDFKRQLT